MTTYEVWADNTLVGAFAFLAEAQILARRLEADFRYSRVYIVHT